MGVRKILVNSVPSPNFNNVTISNKIGNRSHNRDPYLWSWEISAMAQIRARKISSAFTVSGRDTTRVSVINFSKHSGNNFTYSKLTGIRLPAVRIQTVQKTEHYGNNNIIGKFK